MYDIGNDFDVLNAPEDVAGMGASNEARLARHEVSQRVRFQFGVLPVNRCPPFDCRAGEGSTMQPRVNIGLVVSFGENHFVAGLQFESCREVSKHLRC